MRAVEKAGLQWSDIQPVYLAPADARAAFERKSVDAWAIWDPFYAAAELALKPRVLATGRGLSSNNSFYLASRPFATQHPQALAALFEELTRADRLAQENRTAAIKLVADFSGLDAGVVSLFIQRRPPSPVGPLTARPSPTSRRVADAFHKLGLIPSRSTSPTSSGARAKQGADMQVFWFIPTHGDSRYLGTSEGARAGRSRLPEADRAGRRHPGLRGRADSDRPLLRRPVGRRLQPDARDAAT